MEVKGLQTPDDDGGDKNDGKRLLQEVFGLVPQQVQHILGLRHTVVGHFHDKGNGALFAKYEIRL